MRKLRAHKRSPKRLPERSVAAKLRCNRAHERRERGAVAAAEMLDEVKQGLAVISARHVGRNYVLDSQLSPALGLARPWVIGTRRQGHAGLELPGVSADV
eukprot:8769405-Pyramimonas_sp.AAC.1